MTVEMATLLTDRAVTLAEVGATVYLVPKVLTFLREVLALRYDKLGPIWQKRNEIHREEIDLARRRLEARTA